VFAGLEPLLCVGVTRKISAALKLGLPAEGWEDPNLCGGVGVVEIEPDLRGRS
jgi:hypothetical protein